MNTVPGAIAFEAEEAEEALTIHVTDRHGRLHRLPALEGWRVMEVIRDWGLDIKAECGGACACATCHVHVGTGWTEQLPPVGDEEEEMLDGAFDVRPASRLSCQLIMSPELDGLHVTLAAGSEKQG